MLNTQLICNLAGRFNEALSAREALAVADDIGIKIRRDMTDPSYMDPISDEYLRAWEKRLSAYPRILTRTRAVLGDSAKIDATDQSPSFIHIGGPSGGGKTTFALELALTLQCPVVDGDALHTEEAVEIMHNDGKLTDAYRMGEWLPQLCTVITALHERTGMPVVYVCSALTAPVREELRRWLGMHPRVFCYAPHDVLLGRLQQRIHPYIKSDSPSFLHGQWEGWTVTQQSILGDPHSLVLDTTRPTDQTFAEAGEFVSRDF